MDFPFSLLIDKDTVNKSDKMLRHRCVSIIMARFLSVLSFCPMGGWSKWILCKV